MGEKLDKNASWKVNRGNENKNDENGIGGTIFSPGHCGPEQPKVQTEVVGHSFVCLLAHSRARGTVSDWMAIHSVFFFLLFWTIMQEKKATRI